MKAIGIMSGTSLDGIDVVLAEITGSFKETKLNVINFKTYPLAKELNLSTLMEENVSLKALTKANFELSKAYSEAVKDLLISSGISHEEITFIASHGQTIYHSPSTNSTLQIGDGSVLANLTNIQVISNFRTADMAVGGQGAPLVPYMDYCLFSTNKERVLLNIGGIANITYLKKDGTLDDVVAFDTGPGNMMLDYIMNHRFHKPYDSHGNMARSGKLIKELLDRLMDLPYIKAPYPKSTGRELFGASLCREILSTYDNPKDILHTLTHFTALSIVKGIRDVTSEDVEVIASGGGVHNHYLMALIKGYYKQLTTTQTYNINPDLKEALAFVMLGNETLQNKPSNVKSATGASSYVVLGQIAPIGGK